MNKMNKKEREHIVKKNKNHNFYTIELRKMLNTVSTAHRALDPNYIPTHQMYTYISRCISIVQR